MEFRLQPVLQSVSDRCRLHPKRRPPTYCQIQADDAPASKRAQSKFPCDTSGVAQYTAARTHETITVDGKLDEECWQKAKRSARFVDIITGKPTMYNTEVAVLWDDKNLYVG